MPLLVALGTNVCGQRAQLLILGMKPATQADKDKYDANPRDLTIEWERVITFQSDPIDPGEQFVHGGEQPASDAYDVAELAWIVPPALANRFFLEKFTWGDVPLMKKPGLI